MIRRILFTTTAAALLAAAPAFAAETAPSKQPCSCCSDGANHDVDHPRHEAQKQKADAERKTQPRAGDENADLWNGSFGG
jgi:hypothetical protein